MNNNNNNNAGVVLAGVKDFLILNEFRSERRRQRGNYGIKRTSYHLKLENPQSTFPVGQKNIIRAFEEGLANSIREVIDGLPDHDRIQIYIGSNRLLNSHTTANVSVEQWRDPMGASRQVLSNISNLLNSNENFEMDDTLQLDVTHITMPPPGSGLPKGKRKRHSSTPLAPIITETFLKPNVQLFES